MKPALVLSIWVLLLFLWIFFMGKPLKMGDQTLPAIAPFFSPYHGFWQNAESDHEYADINLSHPRLLDSVIITMDERLVPHIFASNDSDAAFAQGYVHARLRLFQMDLSSRAISGRLSEVLGERTMAYDIQTRREGMVWSAEKALKLYERDPASLQIIQAYTDGINHYISNLTQRELPLEFKLLNYCPEEWTLLKSVLTSKSMARTLTSKNYDIQNSNIKAEIGDSLFYFLFPHAQAGQSPVHPGPWTNLGTSTATSPDSEPIFGYHYPFEMPDAQNPYASNNWAVSGKKSASGNPILCNDPHLQLTFPSIWFENHIVTPERNVYGVSLLGVPHVIIGFNENIAWGVTNGGHDVVDWLEVKWEKEDKKHYILDGNVLEPDYRIETIKIKGKNDIIDTVAFTTWGPIAIKSEESGKGDLIYKWSGHDAISEKELATFLYLNNAKNLKEYMEAISVFPSLIQNIVFASKDGDIALKTQGFWPLRADRSGQFISDGSTSGSSWTHYMDNSQIPATINPERQFVSSANQHSTDETYPYAYIGAFEEYRGRTLNKLLSSKSQFSIQDMIHIQNSNYSLKAEESLPEMLQFLQGVELSDVQIKGLKILDNWNYSYDASETAPAIFNEWFNLLEKLTFDETDSEDVSKRRFPDQWKIVEMLKEYPEHAIFDILETTDKKENARELVIQAFKESINSLLSAEKTFEDINWNAHQKPAVNHLLRIPALSRSLEVGGIPDALNAMSSTHGPSWRMIVELTPQGPKAKGVYPGGQSGNPGSKYYDDSIDTWSKGQHHELQLFKTAGEIQNARFTIKMNKL